MILFEIYTNLNIAIFNVRKNKHKTIKKFEVINVLLKILPYKKNKKTTHNRVKEILVISKLEIN